MDLRSLAAFRIAIALCIIADLISRFKYIDFFQTANGFLPIQKGLGLQRFLPHNWDNSYSFQVFLFVLALIFALMLLVGWRTKMATFLTWLMLVSMHSLLEISTDGSDIFLRGILFWSMFLPLGSFWSVDSRNAKEKRTRYFSYAGVALFLFFIFYYLSAGLSKLNNDWLANSALEVVLRQEIWLRSPGRFLSQFPGFLKVLSFGIVVFEIVAPLILLLPQRFSKVRLITVYSFVVFQFCLGICLQLNMMPWVATAALLFFLPSAFWDKFSLSENTIHSERNRLKNTIVLPLMIFVFGGFFVQKAGVDHRTFSAAYTVGLFTTYDFYNKPPEYDYNYKIIAELDSGESVKILSSLDEQTKWKNSTMNSLWQNYRLKYYLETISYENSEQGKALLKWIVNQWEIEHQDSKIVSAQLMCSTKDILKPKGSTTQFLLSDY